MGSSSRDDRSRGRDDKRSSGGRYEYHKRDDKATKERAEQTGGDFDSLFKSGTARLATKNGGEFDLRFLPPTWEDANHYGLDAWVHYGVGASDKGSYLCLAKMKKQPCPICEEQLRAEKDGDTEYAKKLSPKRRVVVWVINRAAEREGPMLWAMPWTLDKDIARLSVDKKTHEVLAIDHPKEGYDVRFVKEGTGTNVRYSGVEIARRESPLSDDSSRRHEWIDYVSKHPVPDVLQYYDYDRMKEVFEGGGEDSKAKRKEDSSVDEKPRSKRREDSSVDSKRRESSSVSVDAKASRDDSSVDSKRKEDSSVDAKRKEDSSVDAKAKRRESSSVSVDAKASRDDSSVDEKPRSKRKEDSSVDANRVEDSD